MNILICIHGADSFSTESGYQDFLRNNYTLRQVSPWEDTESGNWRKEILKQWTSQGGIGYLPTMPNKQNARYADWKYVFESLLATLHPDDSITLVGSSLGGCFLLKYFSEISDFPLQIQQIHLLAACIEEGDFHAPDNYEYLQKLGKRVQIWHAEDDMVVPLEIAREIATHLPRAEMHLFSSEKGYGHLHGIARFTELEGELFS